MLNETPSTPVTAATALKIGDSLQAEWFGSWWPAEVIGLNDDATVRIHFPGWDDTYDESVPRSRLMLGSAPPPPPPPPGPVYSNSLDRLFFGEPVASTTPLTVGQTLHVQWYGAWWNGEIRALHADGSVSIRYPGWGNHWDETVPRSRLQLPIRGERMAIFHLDRNWSLRGKLLEIMPDGYLINRAEDHGVCFIQKENVAFVELENPPRSYVEGRGT